LKQPSASCDSDRHGVTIVHVEDSVTGRLSYSTAHSRRSVIKRVLYLWQFGDKQSSARPRTPIRRRSSVRTCDAESVTTLLEPPAFVWCIAGPHIGETLVDIVNRKRRDIDRFGWCLWAYGGMGNAHPETEVRRLANDYVEGQVLPLLMPDSGKKCPDDGVPFTAYQLRRSGDAGSIPDGTSPVTRSAPPGRLGSGPSSGPTTRW
jgi:hypothetical protein